MSIKCGYKSIIGDYVFNKVALEVKKYKEMVSNDIVDLGVGDVKLPPPKGICEKLIEQSNSFTTLQGFTGYPNECGILSLREKISEYYNEQGANISPDEIFVTTGAKPCIGEIVELSSAKTALIVIPTYPLYEELCKANNIKTTFIKLGELEKIKDKKFDLIFLCSPNNPTGEVIDNALIDSFIELANQNNATIILDGAYADFCDNYPCVYSLNGSERIIEVRTYSKNLCFTGLRCGYVVIKNKSPFNDGYKRYLSLRSNGVNVIMQKTALFAYDESVIAEVKNRLTEYRNRASLIKEVLLKRKVQFIGGENVPYLLCKVNNSGEDFFKDLLNKKGVVVTPGEAFRAEGQIRISCLAPREQIEKGAHLLDEYFLGL
ncbi:MAG: aminotransferase class I/II-fold pyridoxal phosphate-dependent enzyme [Clostridia bacterium]|nr:aminotransferase class I/II-fold pyridoxal phosphate-dependent enzyme [Clostridia bacterium]